ncbi:hypothetical protein GMRT_14645 [Giardia muris]|uniref:Uncharacterized protein n=1 Tax=Giardia muris TaxID=5742 RepID=A0A4Z1T394_GIAMU|nr:hypothetical protein GMRT_14645 [Giardia muris]|eukprot:TNJ27029.1 hypothetical protein GMRT_14645 [Giardia muris]
MACRAEVKGIEMADSLEELSLLEFQGRFSTLDSDTLGLYEIDAKNASYQLGNIALHGEMDVLSRPLYVFTKGKDGKRLTPIAIVKQRIIFDSEPELINTAAD